MVTGRKAQPRILSLDPTSTEAAQFAEDKIVDREQGGI